MMYDQLFAENIHRNKTALEAPNRTPLSYYELSEMIINIKKKIITNNKQYKKLIYKQEATK